MWKIQETTVDENPFAEINVETSYYLPRTNEIFEGLQ